MLQRGHADLSQAAKIEGVLEQPELEPVAKEIRTAVTTEDNSITVIENPSLDGVLGILLSKHFDKDPLSRYLIDVRHIRVNNRNDIRERKNYGKVRLSMGLKYRGPEEIVYRRASTDDGLQLPAPSLLPYEVCFISPDEHAYFLAGLDGNAKSTLKAMYRLLANKVPEFSSNRGFLFRQGRLILPPDYASLRLD